MLYQVTAYSLMGGLQVQCTTARANPDGYQWEHRIMEYIDLPDGVADRPWDVIWTIGQLLSERAHSASKAPWT